MTQERYFIGPGLRDKLRETITRVDGMMSSESGVRVPTALQDMQRGSGGGQAFRICTFTGAWSKNADKTVTFKYQTSTPNTVVATNLFAAIGATSSARNCAVAREGTAWFLVAAEC